MHLKESVFLGLIISLMAIGNGFKIACYGHLNPFFQENRLRSIENSAREQAKGTGLGLLFSCEKDASFPFFLYPGQCPMDLNRVTEEELMVLPGIGQKRAFAILELKRTNGFILTRDELVRPFGPIPQGVFWTIQPYVY